MDKVSILIVDDSKPDRYILKRHMKKTGFVAHFFEAEDGEEALVFFEVYEAKRSEYPDDYPPMIVFLDINMPKIDGFAFLEQFSDLREEVDVKSSVFMMFSSSAREDDKQRALAYSFVKDYLVKDEITPELLENMIKNLIKQS